MLIRLGRTIINLDRIVRIDLPSPTVSSVTLWADGSAFPNIRFPADSPEGRALAGWLESTTIDAWSRADGPDEVVLDVSRFAEMDEAVGTGIDSADEPDGGEERG